MNSKFYRISDPGFEGPRPLTDAPGSPRMHQDATGRLRKPQEAPGRPRTLQEAPSGSGSPRVPGEGRGAKVLLGKPQGAQVSPTGNVRLPQGQGYSRSLGIESLNKAASGKPAHLFQICMIAKPELKNLEPAARGGPAAFKSV